MKFRRIALSVVAVVTLVGALVCARIYMNRRLEDALLAAKAERYSEAIDRAGLLAKLGNSDAQYLLGELHAFGWGVPKDDEVALGWFRRAGRWARRGVKPEAPAAYFVGERYERGTGIEPDQKEALKWYRRSATGGYGPAKERVRLLESTTNLDLKSQ